ncbi:type III pantothenate kinase [Mycoplasmopsis cricetuli]|uniref:type III pantothenate kinase n=1 Tax=Mycoplasmopsis cricetuli TaxID=171283 RepID=UPI00047149D5|nr:type III pantothenate kinase [Mycoplasmopsis cricetuli]
MKKIIIFDIGNTNIKCFLVSLINSNFLIEKESIISKSNQILKDPQNVINQFVQIASKWDFDSKMQFYIASPSREYVVQWMKLLKKHFKNYKINIIDSSYPFNVKTKIDKSKIGIDILAAVNYANFLSDNHYLFMFGTASVAVKTKNKTIQGVSIAPGVSFSFQQLQQFLQKSKSGLKKWKYSIKPNQKLGNNTNEALNSGFYHQISGFIISHLLKDKIFLMMNKKVKIILTGGDFSKMDSLTIFLRELFPKNEFIYVNNAVTLGYLLTLKKD